MSTEGCHTGYTALVTFLKYTGGIQGVYRGYTASEQGMQVWGIQGYTGKPRTPTILNQGYTGGIQHKRYTGVYRFLAWPRVVCIQVGIQGIQPPLWGYKPWDILQLNI